MCDTKTLTFWQSEKMDKMREQNLYQTNPPQKQMWERSVLIAGQWVHYSMIGDDGPAWDDARKIATILSPARVRLNGIEQGMK